MCKCGDVQMSACADGFINSYRMYSVNTYKLKISSVKSLANVHICIFAHPRIKTLNYSTFF